MLCKTECKVCGGIGFIKYDVNINDKKFGKMFPCPERDVELSLEYHGIAEDELLIKLYPTKSAVSIKESLSQLGLSNSIAYIWGANGIGKTLLSKIWLKKQIKQGWTGYYITQSSLINKLRDSYNDDSDSYSVIFDRFISKYALVIDEFGRDRATDFSIKVTGDIIDARYRKGVNAATILISNFAPETLFDTYVLDRLHDNINVVAEIKGKSMRRTKEK